MKAPPTLLLKPVEIPELPASLSLGASGLSLGRDPSNTVALTSDRFPHVSSYHARISIVDGEVTVEDLGSKNGTLVNGREIKKATLRSGDIMQLGRKVGPRFVVVADSHGNETVSVSAATALPEEAPGTATVHRLEHALGLPKQQEAFRRQVRKQNRNLILVALLLFAVAGLATYGFLALRDTGESQEKRLSGLRELNRSLAARLSETENRVLADRKKWEAERARLEQARTGLQTKILRLEENEATSATDLDGLRKELTDTNLKLARIEPISLEKLEKERREILEDRLRSVCYIEKKIHFRDLDTGEFLRLGGTESGSSAASGAGRSPANGQGVLMEEEGGGSGFCVSPDGWIITNAHVVSPLDDDKLAGLKELGIRPEMSLSVVFSGTERRHPAQIMRTETAQENDLALLKIEPFEGLPALEDFDVTRELPAPGTELRLLGFPFGKNIPQEGDTITASVFAGVSSRRAGAFLQVNAAVYPGNSGGPALNTAGHVIGVVTSVQTLASGQISEIGYVLPVKRVAAVWPNR